MNPPYSQKWNPKQGFLTDSRFSDYGVLAPKNAADYSFLLHGFYHLKNTGTMAIVLPHGVLFRSGAEEAIRTKLLENGSIYAVIGLPANLFYNTGIPTCILVLKKDRDGRDVLFIDASKEFESSKGQNVLTDEQIDDIITKYKNRVNVDKKVYLATYDEIEKNKFNINITRYVNTFEPQPKVDIQKSIEHYKELVETEEKLRVEIGEMIKELGVDDD